MLPEQIHGITFAPFARRGELATDEARESLRTMKERTGANMVVFVPLGAQEHPQSQRIAYTTDATMSDAELINMMHFARSLGMAVGLKPTVNCTDGTWRAYISFFDEDVVCEPKWSVWFEQYEAFQRHYAQLAQMEGVDLFIPGCEMVMSEHREQQWRQVIAAVRECYDGPVSYNTDKYQEHNVRWWDACDMISASGYYPIEDWPRQLDRIEQVVKRFNKPFFFAEAGCMSTAGSQHIPNSWTLEGPVDLQAQADWCRSLFDAMGSRDWIRGCVLWSWPPVLYSADAAASDRYYEFYNKPAESVIREAFAR